MGDQATKSVESQAALGSATAILGGGAGLTAISTTLEEGPLPLVMLVIGVFLIGLGAAMLGKSIRESKAEKA